MGYTSVEEYMRIRNKCVDDNDLHWFSNTDDQSPLPSAAEKKLDIIMGAFRQNLVDSHTNNRTPFWPAQPFYEAKVAITGTPLFQAFKMMPKGGMLHMHTSACATAEWILNTLRDVDPRLPKAYVYIPPYNSDQLYIDRQLAFFNTPPNDFHDASVMLRDPSFYGNMLERLTFRSHRIDNIPYIWDEFNNIFALTGELLNNREFYTKYYTHAFQLLINDNVNYLELRSGFTKFKPTSDGLKPTYGRASRQAPSQQGVLRAEDYYEFLDVLKRVASALAGPDEIRRFELKLILCGNRSNNKIDDAVKKMKVTQDLKNLPQYSDFIIGFDLVGEEDRGAETGDFVKEIIENGMQGRLDFYFHDGETNWAFNNNILDAYLIGNKRIGHGFNLSSYPYTLDQFRDAQANKGNPLIRALEICPISNQMLRYTPDLRAHPAYQLLKRGVQCVICSDDPQIFMNEGLSYDFWTVYIAFNFSIMQIKRLILNSYTYSGLKHSDKIKYINDFIIKWNKFVDNAIIFLDNLQ